MGKESSEINPAGIRISRESVTPLYLQVYEQFRDMILKARLRPGDRLPAGRNLAKEIGVSRVIITQAYEQLMIEGYLVGKTGSGTFVAEAIPDNLLYAGRPGIKGPADRNTPGLKIAGGTGHLQAGESVTRSLGGRLETEPFQIGVPSLDQFPYKIWQQVGTEVLKELKGIHLGYEDTMGYMPLRKAIASYLRISRAVVCEADQVIVVTGSQQGLNLVTGGLLKQGDAVWMEDPGYPGARTSFQDAGVELCPIPVREDGLDIAYGIKNYSRARLAYVTPSHQFPLGYTLSLEKRTKLLEWAWKKDMWILEDDYDSEFRYEGRPLESLQGLDTHGKVIYSGTFSKVLFPGLRLAYIVTPTREMAHTLRRVKFNLDRQSPIMEQVILSRFMEEGHFLRHIRKMRLLYAERQKILINLLEENLGDLLQLNTAPSGMHLVCWLSDKIDPEKLKKEIKKEKLMVPFIQHFSLEHPLPPAITLGYTAFSKYKLAVAVEKLVKCFRMSVR